MWELVIPRMATQDGVGTLRDELVFRIVSVTGEVVKSVYLEIFTCTE